ncbi:MAG: aminotransferase class I/II-fold pyridoxal phosphate-dependent enzyme, partial [Saprospiraceae bacterium]|nr:aminotransferase class I/II-fold pyridoxal phosphate-dependent enzyme [Saprospiraceae bacterium]
NNPTGTVMDPLAISRLAASFQGLVVVDEAYMDFHAGRENDSMLSRLMAHPNIVVLQTFSKGWGMAGARLGMAIGNSEIIAVLNQIKAPYNVNSLTARAVLTRLEQVDKVEAQIAELIRLRDALHQDLGRLTIVEHVYPSAANFLLVRFSEPARVHQSLLSRGIVVRDRSAAVAGCLRITVGTAQENKLLIDTLSKL